MLQLVRNTLTMILVLGGAIAQAHAGEQVPDGLEPAEWAGVLDQVAARAGSDRGVEVDPRNGFARVAVLTGDFSGMIDQISTEGPRFGHSVAIDGDWMIVGAPGTRYSDAFHGLRTHGATFWFRRNASGEWVLTRRNLTTISASSGRCGHAVAIRLPFVVVGCPGYVNPDNAQNDGKVLIFRLVSETGGFSFHWRLGFSSGRCGTSVAITQDYIAVGCPEVATNNQGGRVRIYRLDPDTNRFDPEATINPPNAAQSAEFGTSVALVQSPFQPPRLAVGAPTRSAPGAIASGGVHVFERTAPGGSPTWTQTDFITAPEQNALALFGRAVAMTRTQLVIGAPFDHIGGPTSIRTGRVYRYARSGGAWQFQQIGYPSNQPGQPNSAEAGMLFGQTIAMSVDNFVAIGAPLTSGLHSQLQDLQSEVGVVDIRRASDGQIHVEFNRGSLRPPPITPADMAEGQFGTSIAFHFPSRQMVVGYPGAGSAFPLPDGTRRGQVWVYQRDAMFSDRFTGLPLPVADE